MFDIMTATVFYSRGQDGLWIIGSMERACHELREIIKGPHHKMNNRLINLMLSATGARVPSCPWLVLAALLSAFTGPASAITLWLQNLDATYTNSLIHAHEIQHEALAVNGRCYSQMFTKSPKQLPHLTKLHNNPGVRRWWCECCNPQLTLYRFQQSSVHEQLF